ncbi:MAG: hypothetical protein ACRDXF_07210 [Acidimicrobiia bacterium]
MSSRIEDLGDLARMLDEGKISPSEYDIVKTELLEAPAEEWGAITSLTLPGERDHEGPDDEPLASWRGLFDQVPTIYRVAAAGAVLALVVGFFLSGNGDAAGSVTAHRASVASAPSNPAPESLGIFLLGLTDGWNAVPDPPLITGGVMTSPESGPLDSFLHDFDGSAVLAGAYDPSDGSVYALMAKISLHDESVSSLYVHLCYLLHPGSQECLDMFVEETGMFGRSHADLAGTEHTAAWEFEGHQWQLGIAGDVETIRVQSASNP